jgi:hypothetical protein
VVHVQNHTFAVLQCKFLSLQKREYQHFTARTHRWPLRPPPSTRPPRRLLLRQRSPRPRPYRIKRSLILPLLFLSPMRPRLRRLRLRCQGQRQCQRRGSGSWRTWASTTLITTRSAPWSPASALPSSRLTLP